VAAGAAVLLVVAGTAWWARPGEGWSQSAAETAPPVTAAVERAALTSQVRLNGQLGYGDAAPLPPASGMITALPASGVVVGTGERVYEVEGAPVVLFRGERPFWRELSIGAADGEDVRQLEQNLSDLGLLDGGVDARFDRRTSAAVREWQRSLGLAPSGAFSPGTVVVAASPGMRIDQVTARPGDPAGTSPAMVTGTTLRATARLTAAQAGALVAGAAVTVILPDGSEIDAQLAAVDPGGQPTGEGETATSPTATVEFQDQSQVARAGAVAVRVVIRDAEDQPVTLVVPVTALLATAEGDYAVEVWDGERAVRTPVAIGSVVDARAQVLASGAELDGGDGAALAEGDLVVLAR
jgi:peptidoglycan hydrolase-like protein with peptidoglycan-binding domain